MQVKCIVSCRNANGEPDLFFVKVNCTENEYSDGIHYEKAKEAAETKGYEDIGLAYDENDNAGNAMTVLAEWDSMTTV